MTLIEAAKRVQAAWRDPQGMPELCKAMDALDQAIAKAEQQEPVAWLHPANPTCVTTDPTAYARGIPLYKAQPKREWQGLTFEEMLLPHNTKSIWIDFARAIEAKLKEKNT